MSLQPKQNNFEENWQKINHTITQILTSNKIEKDIWNDCFLQIYTLCVAFPECHAQRLYQETNKFLKTYLQNLRKKILSKINEQLLFQYYKKWVKFNGGMKHLQTLFMHLNQLYIKKEIESIYNSFCIPNDSNENIDKYEIGELGIRLWRKIILTPEIINQLILLIIECLTNDREQANDYNKYTDAYIIRGCIHSFTTIDEYHQNNKIYKDLFEEHYMQVCAKHFKNLSKNVIKTGDIISYLNEVTRKLGEESLRSQKYLDPISENKITQIILSEMIENHLPYINKECTKIIKNNIEEFKEIYPLLKRVNNGLVKLLDILYEFIIDDGLTLIKKNNYTQFVENVLKLHEKYSNIIVRIFNNDKDFHRILDRACAHIINYKNDPKTICKSAGFLAKYCDNLIKKSAISTEHDEIEFTIKLDRIIIIFRYLDDKDYFHKFYSRLLAKRLIYEQSDMNIEELMINKLKNVCGYDFINKLHRMYTDICLSSDLNFKFSLYLMSKKIYLIDCHMNILQSGAWPLQSIFDNQNYVSCTEFQKCIQIFEQFYSKNYSGKKLQWLFNLSMVDVKLNYLKQTYFLTLSTPHLIILHQFETIDHLTVNDILSNTAMTFDDIFKRHLNGLLDLKLLLLENNDTEISTDTKLILNLNFSHKRTKLRISPITQKLTVNPQTRIGEGPDLEVCASIEKDRQVYLQAAIVRIMKMHKQLKHNALIEEIFKIKSKAQFTPTINLIKSSIEILIEKAYLSRDEKDPECYNYSA